ncbi:MAG: prolipoprotein diacylglyceryl transferase [Gammaproteobacteria bacterium]
MIYFPAIDPVAVQIGPLAIHWYGLSYVAGIGLAWWYLRSRAARFGWNAAEVGDLVFYIALGGVVGGRVGYVLFYNAGSYIDDPLAIFAVWQGGMSFHGGLLGMAAVIAWLARRSGRRFLEIGDFIVPAIPIGLGLGRIANFVNQELWGAPTNLPWGVVFSHPAAGGIARHPTQLYEAFLEGLCLFVLLYFVSRARPPLGVVSGVFLAGYGLFRSLVELVREPDQHIGYLAGDWLTMGQVLSLPMFAAGLGLLLWGWRRSRAAQLTNSAARPLQ